MNESSAHALGQLRLPGEGRFPLAFVLDHDERLVRCDHAFAKEASRERATHRREHCAQPHRPEGFAFISNIWGANSGSSPIALRTRQGTAPPLPWLILGEPRGIWASPRRTFCLQCVYPPARIATLRSATTFLPTRPTAGTGDAIRDSCPPLVTTRPALPPDLPIGRRAREEPAQLALVIYGLLAMLLVLAVPAGVRPAARRTRRDRRRRLPARLSRARRRFRIRPSVAHGT
jgi:hypothetical protein